jgi:hypothetical protein
MKGEGESASEIVLYRTEDGRTRIDGRFEDGTIWLTQAQIAELFQNITQHLRQLFDEGELHEGATCKDYLQVRSESDRVGALEELASKLKHLPKETRPSARTRQQKDHR